MCYVLRRLAQNIQEPFGICPCRPSIPPSAGGKENLLLELALEHHGHSVQTWNVLSEISSRIGTCELWRFKSLATLHL